MILREPDKEFLGFLPKNSSLEGSEKLLYQPKIVLPSFTEWIVLPSLF
jgi:hypothetical protein